MKTKTKNNNNEVIEQAEKFLSEIKICNNILEEIKQEAEEELKTIKEKYAAEMQSTKNRISEIEKQLVLLLKSNRALFFSEGDYKNLKNCYEVLPNRKFSYFRPPYTDKTMAGKLSRVERKRILNPLYALYKT